MASASSGPTVAAGFAPIKRPTSVTFSTGIPDETNEEARTRINCKQRYLQRRAPSGFASETGDDNETTTRFVGRLDEQHLVRLTPGSKSRTGTGIRIPRYGGIVLMDEEGWEADDAARAGALRKQVHMVRIL